MEKPPYKEKLSANDRSVSTDNASNDLKHLQQPSNLDDHINEELNTVAGIANDVECISDRNTAIDRPYFIEDPYGNPVDIASSFLKAVRSFPHCINHFDKDGKSGPKGGVVKDAIVAARMIGDAIDANRNVYFTMNEVSREFKGVRPSEKDIIQVHVIGVDFDAPKPSNDENLTNDEKRQRVKDFKARALQRLRNPPKGIPLPTIIIDSGGGLWAFWLLEQSVFTGHGTAKHEEIVAEIKARICGVIDAFNADGEELADPACKDLGRLARLTGTDNIPSGKKAKAGRERRRAVAIEYHPERKYSLMDFPVADDANNIARAPNQSVEREATVDASNIRYLDNLEQLPETVADWCPYVIQTGKHPSDSSKYKNGTDNSDALFAVLQELVRAGVDDGTILGIVTNKAYVVSQHVHKNGNAMKNAIRQLKRAKQKMQSGAVGWLEKWNKKYAIIQSTPSGFRIVEEVYNPETNCTDLVYHTKQSLKDGNLHQFALVNGDGDDQPKRKPIADLWIQDPRARRYKSVVFMPGPEADRCGEEYYNLWKGFRVEAEGGSNHESYLVHLRDNICSGNEENYNYLLNWMARGVQYPNKPGEVAIVMKGNKGNGKTFAAESYGHLFGLRHAITVSNPKHLTGQFNGHMQGKCFLFADEAFFAGDRSIEGSLKSIITGDQLPIERKGIDVQGTKNRLSIMMASNNDWVVPASKDERRYAVLNVSDARKQDNQYFKAIKIDLENGGYKNLLYYLQNRDISNFDVRKPPVTDALREQQSHSLDPMKNYILEMFQTGEIPFGSIDGETGEILVPSRMLLDEIKRHYKNPKDVGPNKLSSFLYRPQSNQGKGDRAHLGFEKRLARHLDKEVMHFVFPRLSEARKRWDQFQFPFDWDNQTDWRIYERYYGDFTSA